MHHHFIALGIIRHKKGFEAIPLSHGSAWALGRNSLCDSSFASGLILEN